MTDYYGLKKGFSAILPFVSNIHAGVGKGYLNMEILIVEIYEPKDTASDRKGIHRSLSVGSVRLDTTELADEERQGADGGGGKSNDNV